MNELTQSVRNEHKKESGIAELEKQLKAQQVVIDKLKPIVEAASNYVRHSYEPDCKGDLMRFNELKALINSIGEDK